MPTLSQTLIQFSWVLHEYSLVPELAMFVKLNLFDYCIARSKLSNLFSVVALYQPKVIFFVNVYKKKDISIRTYIPSVQKADIFL